MAIAVESPILDDVNAALLENEAKLNGDNGYRPAEMDDDDDGGDDEGYHDDDDPLKSDQAVEEGLDVIDEGDEDDDDDEGYVEGTGEQVSPPMTVDNESLEKEIQDQREFEIERYKKEKVEELLAKAEEEGDLSRADLAAYEEHGGGKSSPLYLAHCRRPGQVGSPPQRRL